ncbi:IDEAL domain-containing protein [Terrihalobacillus insolitus]|uniref:IDEAL domain-containing protein n=1 Tax=Terrihalobacillus insolitus TaxID=2950438 RepID=UPI00234202BF|nr:IDEAL domain-containing protein [Terrihalobacillus insolitus]MDC3414011.1 IDEAL domain-containing protein [Terrihalobacillus insolitus]
MDNNKLKLEVGDWVKGITRNGELIHGYLEKFQSNHSRVELKVVVSDNEQIIGSTVRLEKKDVVKIEKSLKSTEKQLETLIDLALATRDHTWFMELSKELIERRKNVSSSNKRNTTIDHNDKTRRNNRV